MKKNELKQIIQMESILDKHSALIEELNRLLEHFEKSQTEYRQLRDYYTGNQYMIDVGKADRGEIPTDIKCGIFSEDAVFNMIGDNYHTAIHMLEVATNILKEH